MQSAFYVGLILGGRPLALFGDRIRLDVANVADGTLRQEESGLPGGHFLAPACPFPQLLRASAPLREPLSADIGRLGCANGHLRVCECRQTAAVSPIPKKLSGDPVPNSQFLDLH